MNHVDLLESKFKQIYLGEEGVVDLAIFDGAKSIQNAGTLMGRKYKKITCIHGGEHAIALFFKDCFNLSELRPLVYVHKQLYDYFGGLKHKPYAIFRNESQKQNNGVNVNLLRITDTRMGGLAIAWLRNIRLHPVLASILHNHEYTQDRDFNVSFYLYALFSMSMTHTLPHMKCISAT